MKNLIVINSNQFGYHIDTFYHCKYLKNDFRITIICRDHGLPKIKMDGVRIVYVPFGGNVFLRTFRFLVEVRRYIERSDDIIFIKYFKGVSLILRLLLPFNCMVLDIRTGAVFNRFWKRKLYDARLFFESLFFKNVTVISKGLSKKLNLTKKAHILPLGAEVISLNNKAFEKLHLIYVGTLYNRNIDVTIDGFKKFIDESGGEIMNIQYTIIGDGPNDEVDQLRQKVLNHNLSDCMTIAGRVPHADLKSWFDRANIGVSYVPITEYYDCQPATKTFEYLLSGMPIIATMTSENKSVIHSENGVLINDDANDFCRAIKEIYSKRQTFNSAQIRMDSAPYTWEKVVLNNLKVYFENKIC